MQENKAKQWDKKAKNYNRYNPSKERFEAKIIKDVIDFGISFKDKNILDVGAGTGVYTLRLAQEAKQVQALDFSEQMLEVLKEDAKRENISNVSTLATSWDAFNTSETYDIALSTMSPALDNEQNFQKFHDIATTKIYLGWAGKRDSDILGLLFEKHGATFTPPNGSAKLKAWLSQNEIAFTCKEIEEVKISTCKEEDGVDKYSWHLEIRDVKPDINIIKENLKQFTQNGIITETTTNHMNLIIWTEKNR